MCWDSSKFTSKYTLCSGWSRWLDGSLYRAQRELMIISAIIAVCNPDKCHPQLVRLHDRLWTCGAEMCPLTDRRVHIVHAETRTHSVWHIICAPVTSQLLYKYECLTASHSSNCTHLQPFLAYVLVPSNGETQRILRVFFLHLSSSVGWMSASLMSSWWAFRCAS